MFDDQQQAMNGGVPQDQGVPMYDPQSQPDQGSMAAAPVQDHQMTPAYPTDQSFAAPQQDQAAASNAPQPTAQTSDHDLLTIKQDALNALSPLVGNLDQSPEEKFRTTMMMIQASDDSSLVKVAYEAAQGIADEKTKAQALLDVINEINYFTSHTS